MIENEEPPTKKLKLKVTNGYQKEDQDSINNKDKNQLKNGTRAEEQDPTSNQELTPTKVTKLDLHKKEKFLSNTFPNHIHHKASTSPKKKINLESKQKIFNYGNYSRYYGYRNTQDFKDLRLEIFHKYKDLFEGKDVLDLGCNSGFITMKIAEDSVNFNIKSIIGLDIDSNLINRAKKFIEKTRKNIKGIAEDRTKYPFNIKFVQGNYVVKDDVLLECEYSQFDLILCLSVTKWIHLNFGDKGLKQAFKRMFLQLNNGGCLLLEPQPWDGYKRRKKLTPEINEIFKSITFKPNQFTDYLLGPEVGFSEMKLMEIPEHPSKGFRRPLQMFFKK